MGELASGNSDVPKRTEIPGHEVGPQRREPAAGRTADAEPERCVSACHGRNAWTEFPLRFAPPASIGHRSNRRHRPTHRERIERARARRALFVGWAHSRVAHFARDAGRQPRARPAIRPVDVIGFSLPSQFESSADEARGWICSLQIAVIHMFRAIVVS